MTNDICLNKHGNPKPSWLDKSNAGLKIQWDGFSPTRKQASIPDTLDFITQRYTESEQFFFVRFGDGEHKIIKNSGSLRRRAIRTNAKRIKKMWEPLQAFDYLNDALRDDLTAAMHLEDNNRFIIASWNGSSPNKTTRYWNFYVFSCGMMHPDIFIPFLINTFGSKKNLFVGPDYVSDNLLFNRMFNISTSHVMPNINSYFSLADDYDKIKELSTSHDGIISASGPATKSLAKKLYDDGINTRLIDIGSLADGICGKRSRKWISRMDRPSFPVKYCDLMARYIGAFTK